MQVGETAAVSGRACPACGSVRTYPHGPGDALVRCLGCRLARAATPPAAPSLARPASHPRELFALADRLAAGRLSTPPAVARALDVACGNGAFLDFLQERGWVTEGLETGPDGDTAERSHKVHRTDPLAPAAETLESGAYHLVSFLDVLQRLPDPVRALAFAARRLAPNGLALVDVPNAQSQGFEDRLSGAYLVFDRRSLSGVAARAGLKLSAYWAGPDVVRSLQGGVARLGPLAGAAGRLVHKLSPLARAADPLVARFPKAANRGPRLVAILERADAFR